MIYSCEAKLNFQHHYSRLERHMILQKSVFLFNFLLIKKEKKRNKQTNKQEKNVKIPNFEWQCKSMGFIFICQEHQITFSLQQAA